MPRIIHFELQADDPERARRFYTDAFGWKFDRWGQEDYWLITTGDNNQPGINGGMLKRKGDINYVNTMDVPDLDAFLEKVIAGGGKLALPKQAVPGVGWLAYCMDTEGNVFGMIQNDPSAK